MTLFQGALVFAYVTSVYAIAGLALFASDWPGFRRRP